MLNEAYIIFNSSLPTLSQNQYAMQTKTDFRFRSIGFDWKIKVGF